MDFKKFLFLIPLYLLIFRSFFNISLIIPARFNEISIGKEKKPLSKLISSFLGLILIFFIKYELISCLYLRWFILVIPNT